MDVYNDSLSQKDILKTHPDVYDGMVEGKITVRTLYAGTIYKFAEAARPIPEKLSSPWWWSQRAFDQVREVMKLDSSNPGEIARMLGAVKYEWSKLDQLIIASIGHPIKVFMGPGRMQFGDNLVKGDILFDPPEDLQQTYIPGIRGCKTKSLSSMGFDVIQNPQFIPITSKDDLGITNRSFRSGTMVLLSGKISLH